MKEKSPFDFSDHWAQLTGLELTEEQLMGKPKELKVETPITQAPKPQTKMEFGLSWD